MPFGTLDLHKKIVEAILVDDAGNISHSSRFPATGEALLAFDHQYLTRDPHIAIEATIRTWPSPVPVANPPKSATTVPCKSGIQCQNYKDDPSSSSIQG